MGTILKEAITTLCGDLRIEYATNRGLFLTYWDKTPAATFNQDALYLHDLTTIVESRNELQHIFANTTNNVC